MEETQVFDGTLKVKPNNLKGRNKLVTVEEMLPFKTLVEISEGANIEDTGYYQMFISRGNPQDKARKYVERFLQKRDYTEKHGNVGSISANIDSKGNLIIHQGYENSSIGAYLGITNIDVEIISRDPIWEKLVTKLYDVRDKRFSYMPLFQPEEHPEFQTWDFARGPDRRNLISEDMGKINSQKWLDVGSLTGYHSRMLASAGAHTEGIEMHKPYVEIADLLNDIQGSDVKYNNKELIQWLNQNNQRQFDGIICLSIIHNIAQNGNPEGAKQTFRTLSQMAPKMYFDIGQANEGGKVTGSGLDLHENNLEKFVRENSLYTSIISIGKDNSYHDRVLFRLSR